MLVLALLLGNTGQNLVAIFGSCTGVMTRSWTGTQAQNSWFSVLCFFRRNPSLFLQFKSYSSPWLGTHRGISLFAVAGVVR